MAYFEAIKKIKEKQFSPIYLVYGTESYLIQDVKQYLVRYVLNEADKDTNVSTYDLEETTIQDVITDAETYPFFGGTKLIFAYHPIFLKARPDKVAVEHNMDALQSYLINPAPYTVLIFIAPYEKVDERKKITKTIKKSGEIVHCEPVKEWELKKWIDKIASDLNIELQDTVNELIAQEVGPNLLALQNEMQKLALYVGDHGFVTVDIAEQLLSNSAETSGFKLVDAVIDQKLDKAIQIFKELEKAKEEPIALLALLASQFRTIYHVKVLSEKGYSQKQMAQQLKVHPFVVKMAHQREKSFSYDQLKRIIQLFTETDVQMKQGQMEKGLAFELLLYHLVTRTSVLSKKA
ncbi:DNA polymerase III subunit delta [Aquibacillus sp. 3ASR75-11]|uniref:DNA polymerase III subunit delta n=1 Tax=Terrihalobacillus insolitus TaxID=2950438 RepID=A0A9X3WX41_9BACI|nr:DNA polymerase III subunit delta [Terrihalobacillus insolitus]MDC3413326.1 DNA polymerase III subunit delta [Terrihalobacillus insolitus]MDC3424909.1 DNA polymerase III subunit delta [Terrihalobacillus insolitus]